MFPEGAPRCFTESKLLFSRSTRRPRQQRRQNDTHLTSLTGTGIPVHTGLPHVYIGMQRSLLDECPRPGVTVVVGDEWPLVRCSRAVYLQPERGPRAAAGGYSTPRHGTS